MLLTVDGYLEQAAAELMAAAEKLPLDHVLAATEELAEAIAHMNRAGANIGQQLAEVASGIRDRLQNEAGALEELRTRLESAASWTREAADY